MPTFRYETNKGTYEIDSNRELSPDELGQAISGMSGESAYPVSGAESKPLNPLGKVRQFIETAPERTEQQIAKRPSMIASLIQDPTTLKRFTEHPLGTSLRTLGGAYELAEGIPASMALAFPGSQSPKDLWQAAGKVVTGQRPAQYGDILRSAGMPEPIAATGGLLMSGLKGTPTAGLGEVTAKLFSPATKALSYLGSKFGKPAIARVMNFMTGKIPPKHAQEAMEHPEWLSPKWVKQEGKAVSELFDEIVKPLESNPNAIVDITDVANGIQKIGLYTPKGEPTHMIAGINKGERGLLKNWLDEIMGRVKGRAHPDVNRVNFLIRDMDRNLKGVYAKKNLGQEAITPAFGKIVKQLRFLLDSARKTQYPEIAPIYERASSLMEAQNVARSFSNTGLSFFKAIPAKLGLIALGTKSPVAAMMAGTLTMPAAWKGAIRGGSALGKGVAEHPSYLLPLLREQMGIDEQNQ